MPNLTGKTRVHFLIGSPIAQVLAPGLLTDRMREMHVDAILVPLQIEKEDVETTLPALMRMPNVDSILITIPHKFTAYDHCTGHSERALALKAVNAMRRGPQGWFGDNFDGAGFVRGLENGGHSVMGKRVFMAGSGAAGSSIAVAMLAAGASHITFTDIQPESASRLFRMLEDRFPGRSVVSGELRPDVEIVVNASSAGLEPGDPLPIDPSDLRSGMIFGDVITDPLPTAMVQAASAAGCHTCDGRDMLEGQMQMLIEFMLKRH
jgi:shikimate dehydrogenase